ncbi:MAG: (Fe-S)-binding protein [Dehalococcoidia bacterium]|nr:MAG: (Fe-S)-binding protein [Dehalococcoidia bacterium]
MSQSVDTILLQDETWERVDKATGGAAAPCFQCGVCTAICPLGLVKGETISIRKMVRQAQLGLPGWADGLWECTTCLWCESRCPHEVDITRAILGLRQLAWKEREVPEGLPTLLWDVYFDGNTWGRPPSERPLWTKDVTVKEFSSDDEILLYVGDDAAYDRRIQKVGRALVSVLEAAGVTFGTLGEHEPSCGDAVRSVGHGEYAAEIIDANARLFQEAGVKTAVTVSPHSYDMFANRYPNLSGDFRPLHYSQYLLELIEGERLKFENELPLKVTYHDPCYLSRRNGICDEPRQVLQSIPGLELVEMERSREDTLCCGGGGGRMWMETAAGERFSDLRVPEAAETGAEVVVTCCPYCLSCLEDSLNVIGKGKLRVMELAEVAHLALQSGAVASDAASGRS